MSFAFGHTHLGIVGTKLPPPPPPNPGVCVGGGGFPAPESAHIVSDHTIRLSDRPNLKLHLHALKRTSSLVGGESVTFCMYGLLVVKVYHLNRVLQLWKRLYNAFT